jgi:TldD protein
MLQKQTPINLAEKITLAEKIFFNSSELDKSDLEKILSSTTSKSIDYADLYFQAVASENWYLEDSIVKSGSYSSCKGFGFRAISNDKTGLAFSEDLSLDALKQAANTASSIAIFNKNKLIKINHRHKICKHDLYQTDNPLLSISDQEKTALLQTIDELARKQDPKITQVIASLAGSNEIIFIITSDGTITADLRPLIRLNLKVIAEDKALRTQGIAGGGGRFASYKLFTENNLALANSYVQQAVRLALLNLEAKDAPAGSMPVVLGPGWPGILLHEAIGHGLEGDFIRKGSSAFTGKLGEKVASNLCTVIDNGCIEKQRGSLNIDDEGTPTQATTLIENGILKNYLQDKLNAKLMKQKSTGNGRRQSYSHQPIPRMTNTYMLAGHSDPEDIIKTVSNGLYAVNFAGGQVDITSGKFVFEASEAYLIKNGKITTPVKGATLIGNGPEVLQKVTMVGNDLQLDPGIGTCGKDGQNVPVGVGQPTLLISELTVGGTAC